MANCKMSMCKCTFYVASQWDWGVGVVLCDLLNSGCLGTFPLDQGGMSWTSDTDIDLIRFLDPNLKRLADWDRMSWDSVEIKAV